jgi:Flp pilus assembly protein TadD
MTDSMGKDGDRGPMDQLEAHLDRGWDLVSRGDFVGALKSARETLALDESSPEAHNLMGYVLAAEGRAEEAVEHYRQAIDLDDTFVEAMLNAAEVLIHPLHDYEGALALVDDALELCEGDDEIADAMLLKFDAYLHMGDRAAAARVVGGLPEGPFESPGVELMVGRAKLEVGDPAEAEAHLRGVAERDPRNPDAHYFHALALERLAQERPERRRDATVAFLRARELDARLGPPPWGISAEQFEQRVQAALATLDPRVRAPLEGALFVVSDLPGAEVVGEGVDPRAPALLDGVSADDAPPAVERVFVYQRNVERAAGGADGIEEEIAGAIEDEVLHAFPAIAREVEASAGAPEGPGGLREEGEPRRMRRRPAERAAPTDADAGDGERDAADDDEQGTRAGGRRR